jgi:hypothetical protein
MVVVTAHTDNGYHSVDGGNCGADSRAGSGTSDVWMYLVMVYLALVESLLEGNCGGLDRGDDVCDGGDSSCFNGRGNCGGGVGQSNL